MKFDLSPTNIAMGAVILFAKKVNWTI